MPIVGNKHFDYTSKGIAAAKAASAASGLPMSTAGGKAKKKKKSIVGAMSGGTYGTKS
jgi:hypothetical protein